MAGLNEYFDSVMESTDAFLSGYGFKRSGRSASFYRIDADRTRGWMIRFRCSAYNTPDVKQFGINYVCLKSAKTVGESGVTVGLLKSQPELDGLAFDVFRLDGRIAENESVRSYFSKTIRPKLIRILTEWGYSVNEERMG